MDERPDRWCILRCSPGSTIALADALAEGGFLAWTPSETVIEREGDARGRVRRRRPMTSTFVFADHGRVGELVRLSAQPGLTHMVWDKTERRMVTKGRPHFTLFRYADAYPWVADRDLDPLRLEEQRVRPREKVTPLKPGDMVTHPGNGFEGMTGEVVRMNGKLALVCFAGSATPFQFDPRLLIAC